MKNSRTVALIICLNQLILVLISKVTIATKDTINNVTCNEREVNYYDLRDHIDGMHACKCSD